MRVITDHTGNFEFVPGTRERRPKCLQCKQRLVVPEDMDVFDEDYVDDWNPDWHMAVRHYCFRCCERHTPRYWTGTEYRAMRYADWIPRRLRTEELRLKAWNEAMRTARVK